MFFMSWDTINALKKYLKLLKDKGLHRICGKNITVAEKEIVAVCFWLKEVGALTYKMVVDVLTGLTNCSVPDFVMLFGFFLQQVKLSVLDTDTCEGNVRMSLAP